MHGRKAELIARIVEFQKQYSLRDCKVVLHRMTPEFIQQQTKNKTASIACQNAPNSYQIVTRGAKRRIMCPQPPTQREKIAVVKAKKVRGRKECRKIVSNVLTMQPSLQRNEMVWAYVRGFQYYPGILEDETPDGKYIIHFFGDYSRANVHKKNIKHFMEGYLKYSEQKNAPKLLFKAVEESKIFLFSSRPHRCYICHMLEIKKSFNATQ